MTTEELLKPRYKVIADYIGNRKEIGDIIYERITNPTMWAGGECDLEKYPHLFRKLEWHEERKPEEMPEYVKFTGECSLIKKVFPLNESIESIIVSAKQTFGLNIRTQILPSTKEEYEAFIKSTIK